MLKFLDKAVEPSKASITSSILELQEPKSILGVIGYQLTIFNTEK